MDNHQLELPLRVDNSTPASSEPKTIDSRDFVDESTQPTVEETKGELHRGLSRKRVGVIGILLAALLMTLGFFVWKSIHPAPSAQTDKSGTTSKSGKKKGDRQGQVVPVMVASVTQKTVPIQLQAIGRVQSGSTVAITPQASGRITGVFFKKGQDVNKGDLLFTLDDRSQIAAIQQAQGVLARDMAQVQQARAALARDQGIVQQAQADLAKTQAQMELSQAQSDRYNNLYKQGAISQDQAQQYSTSSRVSVATQQSSQLAIANAQAVVEIDEAAIRNAEGVVVADQAALDAAEVQLSYTKIYAPIDGKVGNILVTEGNVVQANSANPLATIVQVRPIQVSFSVPEVNLPVLQSRMERGTLKVTVTFAGSSRPILGQLTFLNNTVDNTTGTIQLIGDFKNADGKLFPGQFVNTTLTLAQQRDAIVVPAQAVQNGPNGQFVFVVSKDETTVKNVPVVAVSSIDGLNVIQKGELKPGDRVVTDGQANLVNGSKIRIKTADEGKTPATDGTSTPSGKSRKHRSSSGQPTSGQPTSADGDQPAQPKKRHRQSGGDQSGKDSNGNDRATPSPGGTP